MIIWKIIYRKEFNSKFYQQKYPFSFADLSFSFVIHLTEWTAGNIDQYVWVGHNL